MDQIGRLHTLGDIARECANLYRRAAKGKITSADASRQASILAVMRQCVESSDTEKRLEEILEKAAGYGERLCANAAAPYSVMRHRTVLPVGASQGVTSLSSAPPNPSL